MKVYIVKGLDSRNIMNISLFYNVKTILQYNLTGEAIMFSGGRKAHASCFRVATKDYPIDKRKIRLRARMIVVLTGIRRE